MEGAGKISPSYQLRLAKHRIVLTVVLLFVKTSIVIHSISYSTWWIALISILVHFSRMNRGMTSGRSLMTTTTSTTTTTPRPYLPQSNYGLPYPPHQSPAYYPHLHGGGRPTSPPQLPIAPASIPPPSHIFLNFSQPLPGGYPNRQYTLFHYNPGYAAPADDPDFIYSALIRPELVAQQLNEQITHTPWWKRFGRSKGSTAEDKIRTRRQSNNNGNGTSVTLCPTRSEYVMPKAAMNSKGNWMYVVNLEQDRFTQLVRSTTCISQQCSGLCSLPSGYTSRCEQQYVQKRLVALESGGGRLYTDVFWFPHCCLCQLTQTGNTNNG